MIHKNTISMVIQTDVDPPIIKSCNIKAINYGRNHRVGLLLMINPFNPLFLGLIGNYQGNANEI